MNSDMKGVTIPSKSGTATENKNFFETTAKWLIWIIALIPRLFVEIVQYLLGEGASFLGSVVFLGGVLMSSDSYWQMLGGAPLLPYFEFNWIGFRWLPGFSLFPPAIWPGALSSPTFWFAVIFSCVTQSLQSHFFSASIEKIAQGKSVNPRTVGIIAIATFGLEIALTFASRNPLRYSEPSMVFGCLMYNVVSILAAECGHTVYKIMKTGK